MNQQNYYVSEGDTATFIVRHATGLSAEELRAELEKAKGEFGLMFRNVEQSAENLGYAAQFCRLIIGLLQVAQPGSPSLVNYITFLGRALGANAARYAPGKDPIVVDLGATSGPAELPRADLAESDPARTRLPTLEHVILGYHAAMAARDQVALDLLGQAPLEGLLAVNPSPAAKAFLLPYALGLRALFRQDSGYLRYFLEAMANCNSQEFDQPASDYGIFIQSPSIELAICFTLSDQDAAAQGISTFDPALRQGLTYHRHYWRDFRSNTEPIHSRSDGFVALPLLAWASLRIDLGLPVSIRSDYLPQNILEKSGGSA